MNRQQLIPQISSYPYTSNTFIPQYNASVQINNSNKILKSPERESVVPSFQMMTSPPQKLQSVHSEQINNQTGQQQQSIVNQLMIDRQTNQSDIRNLEKKVNSILSDYQFVSQSSDKNNLDNKNKLNETINTLHIKKNELNYKLTSLQTENDNLKFQLKLKNSEYQKLQEDSVRQQKDLMQTIETMKMGDDQRIRALLDQIHNRDYDKSHAQQIDDLNNQISQLFQNKQDLLNLNQFQLHDYEHKIAEQSHQKDEITKELNAQMRVVESYQIQLASKDNEIEAWKDRLRLLQKQNEENLEQLKIHFQELVQQRLSREIKQLSIKFQSQKTNEDTQHRVSCIKADDSHKETRTSLWERERELNEQLIRTKDLEYQLQQIILEKNSIYSDLQLKDEAYRNIKVIHQRDISNLQKQLVEAEKYHYDQGYNNGISSIKPDLQSKIDQIAKLKQGIYELQTSNQSLSEEIKKLNYIINQYKTEISLNQKRYLELQEHHSVEINKLKLQFEQHLQNMLQKEKSDTGYQFKLELDRLKSHYDNEINQLNNVKIELQRQIHRFQQQIQEIPGLEHQIDGLHRQQQMKDQQLNDFEGTIKELQLQLDNNRNQSQKQIDNMNKEFQVNMKKRQQDYDQVVDELQDISNQKTKLEQLNIQKQKQYETCSKDLDHLRKQYYEIQQNYQSQQALFENEMNQQKQLIFDYEDQIKQLRHQNQELLIKNKNFNEQLEREMQKIDEQETDYESQLNDLKSQLAKMNQDKFNSDNSLKKLRHEIQEYENKLSTLELNNQNLQTTMNENNQFWNQQNHQLNNEKLGLENQIKQLKHRLLELEHQAQQQQIDLESFRSNNEDLKQQIDDLQNNHQQEIHQWESNYRKLDSKFKEATLNQGSQQQQILIFEEEIVGLKDQNEQLEQQCQDIQERFQTYEYEMTEQVTTLTVEIGRLQRFEMNQKDWEVRLQAQKSAFETQIEQMQLHQDDLEQQILNYQNSIKRIDKQLHDKTIEYDKLKQLYNHAQPFENDFNELQEEYQKLELDYQKQHDDFKKINALKAQLEKQVNHLQEEIDTKDSEVKDMQNQTTRIKKDLDSANTQKEALKKEVSKQQSIIQDKDTEIQLVQEQIQSLERENQDSQKQLTQTKNYNKKLEEQLKLKQQETMDKINELDQIKSKYEANWQQMQLNTGEPSRRQSVVPGGQDQIQTKSVKTTTVRATLKPSE